jgi:hypothetical protein
MPGRLTMRNRKRYAFAAAFLAGALAARLAGAVPVAAFAAAAFLAGALVTVRFTGSSIAGLTFVAATCCTPSVLQIGGLGVRHRESSAVC